MEHGPCMVYNKELRTFQWWKYARGETLDPYIPIDIAWSNITDLLEGMNYLHNKGVCHRDIKPDNLLTNSSGTLRIADFGCAMKFDKSINPLALATNTVGTTAFWAPECSPKELSDLDSESGELIDDLPPSMPSMVHVKPGDAVSADDDDTLPPVMPSVLKIQDVGSGEVLEILRSHPFSCLGMDNWASGVTIYCMLFGRLPFPVQETNNLADAMKLISELEPIYKYSASPVSDRIIPADAQHIVRCLLDKQVSTRITCRQALDFVISCGHVFSPRVGEDEYGDSLI